MSSSIVVTADPTPISGSRVMAGVTSGEHEDRHHKDGDIVHETKGALTFRGASEAGNNGGAGAGADPDERAAGVISGEDPYRELELYLEKVQDEIGEVFDRWKTGDNGQSYQSAVSPKRSSPKVAIKHNLPANKKQLKVRSNTYDGSSFFPKDQDAWSDGLMEEFNNIIKNELDALNSKKPNGDEDDDDVFLKNDHTNSFNIKNGELRITEIPDNLYLQRHRHSLNAINNSKNENNNNFAKLQFFFNNKVNSDVNNSVNTSEDYKTIQNGSKGRKNLPEHGDVHYEGNGYTNGSKETHNGASVLFAREIARDLDKDIAMDKYSPHSRHQSSLPPSGYNKQLPNPDPKDMATQTSPGSLSPSSSLTWVSDSSLFDREDTVDDDNKSTTSSSNADSMRDNSKDELSCDCLSSGDSLPESPNREEPESGIGTASPPRDKDSWKRLRRRSCSAPNSLSLSYEPLVWVRRENVETQTCDPSSNENFLDDSILDSSTPDELDLSVSSLPISGRSKLKRPCCLPLLPNSTNVMDNSNEFFQNNEQPSPSTASLRLNPTPLPMDLGNKSSSAPILLKKPSGENGAMDDSKATMRTHSQSDRQLTEIEAQEACKWLRAAGFPQYAQMYEDLQFPIDLSGVQKDHPFLEPDPLKSLYRRLGALNRCAIMRLDVQTKHVVHAEDSDDDTQCALSEAWTFQPQSRRWSRVDEIAPLQAERLQAQSRAAGGDKSDREDTPDRLEVPGGHESDDAMLEALRYSSLPPGTLLPSEADLLQVRFRRTGSERIRDGAKAFLRRVESLKTRRRKRQNRDGLVISGPEVVDVITMQQKMDDLNCVDVSPTASTPFEIPPPRVHPPSPLATPPYQSKLSPGPYADDSSSYCSDGSQGSAPRIVKTKPSRARRFLQRGGARQEDLGALSDSDCQPTSWKHRYIKDANSNNAKVEFLDARNRSKEDEPRSPGSPKKVARGGSLNLGKESQGYRDRLRGSFRRDQSGSRSSELSASQDSGSTLASHDSGEDEVIHRQKSDGTGVRVRWHSFQRGSNRPDIPKTSQDSDESSTSQSSKSIASMSCGQLQVLRKMALLTLTGHMERYCPTHRTGWNWELPKFIRKIKTPDYKDKTVFGVPLALSMQRSGQAIPKCIQIALRWLRNNAMEQVGIFRKSGVKSRIQLLKTMTEKQGDAINYDGQQAFDVADMVKQYFRELPEALLTTKLSETFIAVFQHVPEEYRHDAVQCVLLLLPDEHREALQTLLDFLQYVTEFVNQNQMTMKNLAVCWAPSLFHSSHGHGSNATPSKKGTGVPDARELLETRATHDCLQFLIKENRTLFNISREHLDKCNFNYFDESKPMSRHELGQEHNQTWSGYQYACTLALLKEARKESRGWVSLNSTDHQVDLAYKKVGDGHPLRLWRISTEVEAPPQEVLNRILHERHIWDNTLIKCRVLERLEIGSDVYRYVSTNMPPLGARDYCVLRSWNTDLPKGACAMVETSVKHPQDTLYPGSVRGVVLASRYFIEPCGSGRSRVMHLSRVDTKGRTPEFYTKIYGHICASQLTKLRQSFSIKSEGPESKV